LHFQKQNSKIAKSKRAKTFKTNCSLSLSLLGSFEWACFAKGGMTGALFYFFILFFPIAAPRGTSPSHSA
jgi:hypothetical protein